MPDHHPRHALPAQTRVTMGQLHALLVAPEPEPPRAVRVRPINLTTDYWRAKIAGWRTSRLLFR